MIVDLHNHTPLCNHAEGEIDEYILAAVKAGTKVFGFADHAPMNFDQTYRMRFEDMKSYEADVLAAKERYKDRIKVLLGYEVDYLENYIDPRVINADVDYLIGSVHFIDKWGFDNPEFIGKYEEKDIDEIWEKYFSAIEDMAKTKLFDIVGHLDLIKIFKFMPKKKVTDIAKNALLAIKEADMTLELNVAGYRKPIAEAYPSKELLQEAFVLGIPITFCSDAHKPEQVNLYNEEVVQLARDVGYKECAYYENRERKFLTF
ncbi:MAG: histidinol-phosphatase HisJ family protein [Sulfurimonas sp.]